MTTETTARGQAAISNDPDWESALRDVLTATEAPEAPAIDLALLFASTHYQEHYAALIERAYRYSGATLLAGCSGQGVVGPRREVEGTPALSLLRLSLPGARLEAVRVTQELLTSGSILDLSAGIELPDAEVNAWLLIADPFQIEVERLIAGLEARYPHRPIAGGLASGRPDEQRTHLFLNERVYTEGAVCLAIGGGMTLRTVVAQGATPIGQPWIVTGAHANLLEMIGGRPAYDVLVETVQTLPPDLRRRALNNLLVGLAMDEYREEHGRGDYLIRNLVGVDRDSGALAIGAYPRIGQTVQFQLRDGRAADEDLDLMLQAERKELAGVQPAAGLLCACNGRGRGLFGVEDHDAAAIADVFGALPLAGFFCNGEIGPVGGKTFLHGFTASLALFVARDAVPPPAGPSRA